MTHLVTVGDLLSIYATFPLRRLLVLQQKCAVVRDDTGQSVSFGILPLRECKFGCSHDQLDRGTNHVRARCEVLKWLQMTFHPLLSQTLHEWNRAFKDQEIASM